MYAQIYDSLIIEAISNYVEMSAKIASGIESVLNNLVSDLVDKKKYNKEVT